MITIENDGQDVRATNYWQTEHAQKGYAYLSLNAGAFRLLLSAALAGAVSEMRTAVEVIVSRGPWADHGDRDALEIMFEDNTDNPYVLHLVVEQADMLPSARRDNLRFAVWTEQGKALDLPGKFRKVKRIPWMRPWQS